ncbi:hypothetical protein Tco_1456377 [Tanacetum coccineum]
MDEYPELSNDSYVLYDRVMNPLVAQLGRKVRRDRGTRRGHPSTSSSTFDQPSLSHLNDDDDDENNKGTSRASTPSPIRYVNSLTNQLRDEQRGGLRLIRKGFRKLWKNLKKMFPDCKLRDRKAGSNGIISQYRLSYSDEGQMFVEFVIQNQLFSYSLENFAQILDVPCEGACVFTDRWRLDELVYGIPLDGSYQTKPHSIEDIISSIRINREGQVRRIRHEEEIDVLDYQILTREIIPTLKPLEEIIRENVFCLGGNRDHVPACLCFMLYCAVHSEKFNLAYFMAKRMEWVTKQARLILPYGMLLTRLFKFIMNEYPELHNESYVLYDRVMNPLAAQLERKPRRDRGTRRGRHSTSSSFAFDQPSSSHLNDDDDDGNDEGTSRASTPSPIRYVNSLTNQVPQVFQNPPNIDPDLEPFYTRQTKIINHQVQLRDEHHGGVRSIGKSLRRLWRNMKK